MDQQQASQGEKKRQFHNDQLDWLEKIFPSFVEGNDISVSQDNDTIPNPLFATAVSMSGQVVEFREEYHAPLYKNYMFVTFVDDTLNPVLRKFTGQNKKALKRRYLIYRDVRNCIVHAAGILVYFKDKNGNFVGDKLRSDLQSIGKEDLIKEGRIRFIDDEVYELLAEYRNFLKQADL